MHGNGYVCEAPARLFGVLHEIHERSFRQRADRETVTIDGKTLHGSFDKASCASPQHMDKCLLERRGHGTWSGRRAEHIEGCSRQRLLFPLLIKTVPVLTRCISRGAKQSATRMPITSSP